MVPNGAISYKMTWEIRTTWTPFVGPKVSIIHRFHCIRAKNLPPENVGHVHTDIDKVLIHLIHHINMICWDWIPWVNTLSPCLKRDWYPTQKNSPLLYSTDGHGKLMPRKDSLQLVDLMWFQWLICKQQTSINHQLSSTWMDPLCTLFIEEPLKSHWRARDESIKKLLQISTLLPTSNLARWRWNNSSDVVSLVQEHWQFHPNPSLLMWPLGSFVHFTCSFTSSQMMTILSL